MVDTLVGELRFEIRRIAMGNVSHVVHVDISPPLTMERHLDPIRPGQHVFMQTEGGGRVRMIVLEVGEGVLTLGAHSYVDNEDVEVGILVRPAQHAMNFPD